LKTAARRGVLARAAEKPDAPRGLALSVVLDHASDMTYEEALSEFIDKRDVLRAWIVDAGDLPAALRQLRRELGLGETENLAALRNAIATESVFDGAAVGRLLSAMRASEKTTDLRAADRLAPYVAAASDDERTNAWLDFFTTAGGDLRKSGSLVTGAVRSAWPELGELFEAERSRLEALLDRIKAAECYETTAAMLLLADGAVAEYERLKTAKGALDFEDLIGKTANLLSRVDASRWVQYKLDRGLDHILVDEAQDTNPRQWQVIKALASEFFSGAGASEATRTLFAVGDEKQSIYSFQGAVPAWFTRVQRELGRQARDAAYSFADVQLHLSFRSTATVLSAVDKVFDPVQARAGVTTEDDWPYHTAARHREPGRVVVWPLIEPPERPEPDDWAAPLDHLGDKSTEVMLAERIAATVDGWFRSGETIDATGEPIRPGDILILTRTRGAQTDAINRALKAREVPIAGSDRVKLAEHIAVMDLMALARVMLLPEDDLSLAAILKSPLIGLTEDDLFRLAHERTGSLWDALGTAEEDALKTARTLLDAWRSQADWRDPHAFFARVLGPDGARKAFARRLGAEADDVIDEFLAQALVYERTNTPTLQGFIAWHEAAPTEIKRESDLLRDEVRVMTVHGAKGLEAGIVFLVDTGSAPLHSSHDPCVLALTDDPDAAVPVPLVWMRSRKAMPAPVTARLDRLRGRATEEYRRLLYVAMTRARDRLYVCGTRKRNTDMEGGWHALVIGALEDGSRPVTALDGTLLALEWRAESTGAPRILLAPETALEEAPLPDWVARPAAPPRRAMSAVAPSRVLRLDEELEFPPDVAATSRGDGARDAALARGRIIHRLLQSLPDHPPAARRTIGETYLAAIAPELDSAAILAEIFAILDDPVFSPLFGPGSRSEVDIAGRLERAGESAMVSGRIDRLAVTTERVFIVDYKTNRPPPRDLADVQPAHIVQLALYRRILARLYPDRRVTAALLWTDRPTLMEVPEVMLDEAESAMMTVEP
jgi:ATP-dependent helicase/nuclease subunit A